VFNVTTPSQEGQGNLSEDGDFEQERKKLLKAISHFEKAKSNYEKRIQSNKSFIIGIILGLCGNLFITSFFEFGPIQFLQNISGIYWYSIKYIILIISFLKLIMLL